MRAKTTNQKESPRYTSECPTKTPHSFSLISSNIRLTILEFILATHISDLTITVEIPLYITEIAFLLC